ncbi:hypothetical protein AAFF_G00200780 [Aldrovandia affinis]|uniref:Uncharacterized protein n=1 Tax=Aldrovandia affinis TaxID=143900 RepID=A0AAD7RI72_9TELE|nr:hypothetical protein AAFF_G00200780 [Aldrovandia affinis]
MTTRDAQKLHYGGRTDGHALKEGRETGVLRPGQREERMSFVAAKAQEASSPSMGKPPRQWERRQRAGALRWRVRGGGSGV